MNACLQMDEGLLAINMMNLVEKFLMQDMAFVTVLEMVRVVEGRLVIKAGMEDELTGMVVTTVCVLKMKDLMTLIMKRDLMILKIPLQMMG